LSCSSIASAIFINSALTRALPLCPAGCIHITIDQVSVSARGLYVDISWNDPERGAAALTSRWKACRPGA
jgi:hypothetical protein